MPERFYRQYIPSPNEVLSDFDKLVKDVEAGVDLDTPFDPEESPFEEPADD